MKEIPILFKPEMIKAIREGRKTVTRRLRGLAKINMRSDKWRIVSEVAPGQWTLMNNYDEAVTLKNPYGTKGDRLYVREQLFECNGHAEYTLDGTVVLYPKRLTWRWQRDWLNSIHMPKAAARLWLARTSDRPPERLHSISEEGAKPEGVEPEVYFNKPVYLPSFIRLWDSINANPKPQKCDGDVISYVSYPWDEIHEVREHRGKAWYVCGNPFVWVPEFELEHAKE